MTGGACALPPLDLKPAACGLFVGCLVSGKTGTPARLLVAGSECSAPRPPIPSMNQPPWGLIRIHGARQHNLKNLNLDIRTGS